MEDESQEVSCGEPALTPASSEHSPILLSSDLTLVSNMKSSLGDTLIKQDGTRRIDVGLADQLEVCSQEEVQMTVDAEVKTLVLGEAESNSPGDDKSTWSNNPELLREACSPLEQGSSCGVPSVTAQPPLSHPYYLRSFLVVLQALLENEEDMKLFDDQEKGIITKFYELSGIFSLFAFRVFLSDLCAMEGTVGSHCGSIVGWLCVKDRPIKNKLSCLVVSTMQIVFQLL